MNILTLLYGYFAICYYNFTIPQVDHIGGSWINSAKNIEYYGNTLCADLRTTKFTTNDYNSVYKMYAYEHACIKVDSPIRLMNTNGRFEVDTGTADFLHGINFTKSHMNWYKLVKSNTIKDVQFFPNNVCARVLTHTTRTYLKYYDSYRTTYHYDEQCFDI